MNTYEITNCLIFKIKQNAVFPYYSQKLIAIFTMSLMTWGVDNIILQTMMDPRKYKGWLKKACSKLIHSVLMYLKALWRKIILKLCQI